MSGAVVFFLHNEHLFMCNLALAFVLALALAAALAVVLALAVAFRVLVASVSDDQNKTTQNAADLGVRRVTK